MDDHLIKAKQQKETPKVFLFLIFILTVSISGYSQTSVDTKHPSITYTAYRTPVTIAPNIEITASGTISDVKISIETIVTGDVLDVTTISGYSKSWDSSTKLLTITTTTGSGTATDYQNMLRTAIFYTTNATTPRRIDFIMADVVSFEIDGKEHVYELINNGSPITWSAAKAAAEARTITTAAGGTETGYLATITSAEENAFVAAKVSSNTWLGASDAAVEDVWRWVSGPESGTQFWQGEGSGVPVNGEYNNWYTGEPNDSYGAYGEDYMHMYGGTGGSQDGYWNDFYEGVVMNVSYYLVEYGGYPASPTTIVASDYVDITIKSNTAPVADNDSYSRFYTDTGVWFIVSAGDGVLNGDSDADNDSFSAYIYSLPSHGTVSLSTDGSFSYRSNTGYIGTDVFYYRAYDGLSYSNIASVTISVQTPTFTGAGGDDDFNNTANWNCGYIPPESLNIIIGANQHLNLNQNYECKNLQFESGASFDCESPYKLTITGNVLNRKREVKIGVSSSMQVTSSISINNE